MNIFFVGFMKYVIFIVLPSHLDEKESRKLHTYFFIKRLAFLIFCIKKSNIMAFYYLCVITINKLRRCPLIFTEQKMK